MPAPSQIVDSFMVKVKTELIKLFPNDDISVRYEYHLKPGAEEKPVSEYEDAYNIISVNMAWLDEAATKTIRQEFSPVEIEEYLFDFSETIIDRIRKTRNQA